MSIREHAAAVHYKYEELEGSQMHRRRDVETVDINELDIHCRDNVTVLHNMTIIIKNVWKRWRGTSTSVGWRFASS